VPLWCPVGPHATWRHQRGGRKSIGAQITPGIALQFDVLNLRAARPRCGRAAQKLLLALGGEVRDEPSSLSIGRGDGAGDGVLSFFIVNSATIGLEVYS